jgi:nitronate monooxygenase
MKSSRPAIISHRPGEGDIVATAPDGTKVVRYRGTPPHRGMEGTATDLAMYAGQGVDDIKDLPLAGDLVGRLWAECLAGPRA